jgi:predicted metal-binding protein
MSKRLKNRTIGVKDNEDIVCTTCKKDIRSDNMNKHQAYHINQILLEQLKIKNKKQTQKIENETSSNEDES